MIELIRSLQILSVCAWAVPLWVHRSSFWRVLRARPARFDWVCAGVWIVASGVIIFPINNLAFPSNLAALDPASIPARAAGYIWLVFGSQLLTWTAWEARRNGCP